MGSWWLLQIVNPRLCLHCLPRNKQFTPFLRKELNHESNYRRSSAQGQRHGHGETACQTSQAEEQDLHVLVDGCNRPPGLLADGEKWTRMSQRDIEAAKNQRKLSQFFVKKSVSDAESQDVKDPKCQRRESLRPKKVDAVIEGDGRVPSISAASIIAKVHRDRLMERLDQEFPAYGFKSHKGYGTEAHLQAIRDYGVCREHRKSFAPIRQTLEKNSNISEAFKTTSTSSKPSKASMKGTKKSGLKRG
eukprot:Skav211271  [mRNA]  locus=scaffold2429:23822:30654:+ [translate_table: standard]